MVKAKYEIEEYETNGRSGYSNTLRAPDYDVEVNINASYWSERPREWSESQLVEIDYGYRRGNNFGDIVISSDCLLPECKECGAELGSGYGCDVCNNSTEADWEPRDLATYIRDEHGPAVEWLPVYYTDHSTGHLSVTERGRPSGYIWEQRMSGTTQEEYHKILTAKVEQMDAFISGEVYYVDADCESFGDFYGYDDAKECALEQLDVLVNEAMDKKVAEAKLAWLAEWQEPIMREAMEMGVVFI